LDPALEDVITTHTTDEGWPFDAGTPVFWFDAHSRRREGLYLRVNIDDLEECWGDESARHEFLHLMEGSDSCCLECGAELDEETGECTSGCEPFSDHPQEDDIRFEAAYGVRARVLERAPARIPDMDGHWLRHPSPEECRAFITSLFEKDPDPFELFSEVPLSQLFPIHNAPETP
jgi:hypothetical protein